MIFKNKDFIERCVTRLGAILETDDDLDEFDRERIEQAREMLAQILGTDLSIEHEPAD